MDTSITEENNVEYKQKIGIMHACGHDVHTTRLLALQKF
jgi:metal-dependent amidase/aminoacylase/carboxypeptidase family protein